MSIILGIDPSLTGTGLALVDTEDSLVGWTFTLVTKGKADATIEQRLARITTLAYRSIGDYALGVTDGGRGHSERADLVVIEAPSLGQVRQGGTLDRHGLWWLTLRRLSDLGIPVVEIPPAVLKVYATGKGNAGKDEVLLAVARRYPHVDVTNNNEADALVLAAIGHHLLTGKPLVDLPATHTRALDKVARPGVAA